MLRQALRYAVVGVLGAGVHLALMAAGVEWAKLPPLWAAGLGFSGAVAVSYGLNHRWTFASGRAHRESFWRFVAVSVLGLCVNTALLHGLVDGLGWWYFSAQLALIGVLPALNFVLNRHWTFAERAA